MVICPDCGKSMDLNSKFCAECRYKFSNNETPVTDSKYSNNFLKLIRRR